MRSAALCLCSLLLLTGLSGPSVAGEPGALPEWLMAQHRFREAELEYERLAVEATHPADKARFADRLLAAAWATDDPSFVLLVSRAWLSRPETRCVAQLYTLKSLYALHNFPAVHEAEPLLECPEPLRDEAHYLAGLSLLRERAWGDASSRFALIASSSALASAARGALAQTERGKDLRFRSPGLAAGLNALLPGAGYAYDGRPQTAVAALAVTGLFGWAASSTARTGDKGLAALLSLFALGWYAGGIYGGARTAERENESRLDNFVSPLEIHFQ